MPKRKLNHGTAEWLSEETGRDKEEFEYDGPIPDLDDLERESVTEDGT